MAARAIKVMPKMSFTLSPLGLLFVFSKGKRRAKPGRVHIFAFHVMDMMDKIAAGP
jgi:hypothetical protein